MTHPPENINSLDHIERLVVDRYQICVSSFTPAHLIDLMHSVVTYYNVAYQSPISRTFTMGTMYPPSAQFWKRTPALANALQQAIDFYLSLSQERSNLEESLIEVAFLIKVGTSSESDTQDTESNFLRRVSRMLKKIPLCWDKLRKSEGESRREAFLVFVVAYEEQKSVKSIHRYGIELWRCVEKIKARLCTSTVHLLDRNQVPFYTDLRNAFRSHFHETRDSYGLSSLDRLNLNVRVNLFLSHYSRVTWRSQHEIPDFIGLPFYPYMAIIQSSGSGKSRLLRELGRTLPLVYANLGPNESKGYPLSNKSLRSLLLFESPSVTNDSEVDSRRCEHHYKCLLLTTTTVFYLLFSHRNDKRKRVILPTNDVLRNKVSDAGWKTVGICEPDGNETSRTNDLFWEIVTRVTRQLLNDVQDSILDWRKSGSALTAESDAKLPANELKHLEKSLQDMGTIIHSPKGRAIGSHDVWDSSQSPELQTNGNNAIPATGKTDPNDVAESILRYIQLRRATRKETLAEIARSLQRVETDKYNDKQVLHALFFALDESRCLTKRMVQNRRSVAPSQSGQEDTISAFRCLRRIAHHMFDTTGVSIFLLFSDTTAKLANFTPQRALDPSARMLPEQQIEEPPGQVHDPFTALGTESVGVLLLDRTVFDFRERLAAFCRKWGRPALSSDTACVSEQVTSLPFEVLGERSKISKTTGSSFSLFTPVAKTTAAEGGTREAGSENLGVETIFHNNYDYVYLGRPLWASSMLHNDKGATWKDMVVFALEKLLGGRAQLAKGSAYTTQCLAVIACRVPLQFNEDCGIAPQLVAEHMAWCRAVSWDRESVYLGYINEPLLATAAAVLWEQDLEGMLRCLVARCGSYLANKGDLGEVAACILLVHAVDRAYKRQGELVEQDDECRRDDILRDEGLAASNEEVREGSSSPAKKHYADKLRVLSKGLTMYGTVSLKEMLESSFWLTVVEDYSAGSLVNIGEGRTSADVGQAWIPKKSDQSGSLSVPAIFVPRILAEADVRFKSIKRTSCSVGCRDIPFLFEANVAILTQRQQRGVDILIPLRLHLPRKGRQPETAWSCMTVQVKNRQRSPRITNMAGKRLDPIFTGAVTCDAGKEGPCERCIFIEQHHFGVALNVHNGVAHATERDFGRIWTFLRHPTKEGNGTGSPSLSRSSKRRKQCNGHWDDGHWDKEAYDIPRSSCLVINGILDESSVDQGSRFKPEMLRQIESLVAQGTLLGMMLRKTKQRTDSVNEVVAAAAREDDENYRTLIESSKSANLLVTDEEKHFTRLV